ncbi:bifunctional glycosyltransferase/CDP-glycerol:glycerophosphate glycerophosphotransferase [Actinomadura rugatobispora]|uniref:CDP-glycerol glycerophosphotransferase family protein n=1 Tax=Actinomadura rugatobispora TaxID=1994 RepID=A0ABW0ZLX9_9ACTN|nr:hypothetical protein GCM10010200_093450 [Actinomadura rugatobispora]
MKPRVTVVVPIYNVAPYLEECLDSIAAQTLGDLDVVMVDDGSTDASAEIAAAHAARDGRFRLIRQDNHGLGHARNTGAREARGEYLAFVDSDDVLPGHAYELLVGTLERTGSDFASGNTLLLTPAGLLQSPMHRRPMGATRMRTHITRDPLLMYDRLVPNKVFRRSFWRRHGFRFPEGVLYEDIPVTLPAHFLASAVDVVDEPVYHWRRRDGGDPSITQRRTEIKALDDRFAAVEAVRDFLGARPGHRPHKKAYEQVALRSDLRIFLNVLPEGDAAFRARFGELAADFLRRAEPGVLDRLPAIMKLKWHLVGRGLLDEVREVIESERAGGRIPVARRLHRRYAKYPFWKRRRGLRIPKRIFRLREELAMSARLHEVGWRGGRLRVSGHAYIRYVGMPWPWSALKAVALREERTGRTTLLPARPRRCPEATAGSRQAQFSYHGAGFSFALDPKRLRDGDRYVDGTWLVAVGVYGRGVFRRGALAAAASGSGAHPPWHYVAADVRVIPLITRGGTLRLKVENVRAKVTGHRLSGTGLEVSGTVCAGTRHGDALLLRGEAGTVALTCPITTAAEAAGTSFTARIPLRDLPGTGSADEQPGESAWRLELAGHAEDEPLRLVLDEALGEARHAVPGREVIVSRCREGYARLSAGISRPVVTGAAWGPDGTLTITGECAGAGGSGHAIVLSSRERTEQRAFPMIVEDGRFRAELPVTALTTPAGVLPLRAGKWIMRVRAAGAAAADPMPAARPGPGFRDGLPIEFERDGRSYGLRDNGPDEVVLEVSSDLRPDERGPYAQRRVRVRHYRLPHALPSRLAPPRPAVLYDSYRGRQYSDSPRAVHEELTRRGTDLEHLWVVRDAQVVVPDTARPVRLWGREWYEALARSRYIVTNAHLPHWFRRREGQVVLQTWHGTPLKRIGFDIGEVKFADSAYLEKLAEEVRHWSGLISPNRFSTPILRRAFRFGGEIIETGYPRNDVLRDPDRDLLGERVRRRLGLPQGKRAVLYAPTWRDDSFYGPGRYRLDLRLDLEAAAAALGGDFVLLVRRHPNVVDTVPETGDGFVRDVSDYPDIAELFLAADVLLTDYSSLMFDYANTGRPMLFFTYDLERYRDELRGFYFDFEGEAPGPLLATSDEVIDALGSLDDVARAHAGRHHRFTERFCDLDDGKAAIRVVDRLLGTG